MDVEVLAERIGHEREMREALALFLEAQHERDAEALLLQAKEYDRRLENLNHEADRIKSAAAKSVSLEKYSAERDSDLRLIADLTAAVQRQREELLVIATLRAAQAKWIAVAISLIGVALNFLLRTGL